MIDSTSGLEQALILALSLSPLDKIRLIARVAASLERELIAPGSGQPISQPLDILSADAEISTDDIEAARREMWGDSGDPSVPAVEPTPSD